MASLVDEELEISGYLVEYRDASVFVVRPCRGSREKDYVAHPLSHMDRKAAEKIGHIIN